ncbi:MAG: hypothetical protein HUU01_09195 [Saprospiraceae bacterium]|nr:hypothetical protein [Saprospiraceae bacterium]
MRNLVFLFCLCLQTNALLFAKPVPLQEALENGWVKLKATGVGGHQNQAIKAVFENLYNRNLEILVPAGFIFDASDSTYQDLIVVKDRLVILEKDARKSALCYTLCIRANRASPVASLAFLSGGMATGALMQLAQYIDKQGLHQSDAAQYAMWAVSNNHGLEGIGHPELAKFTAQLLGKPEPTYHIQYAGTGQPGEQAFRNEPIAVSGAFEYENKTDITATFALYNEAGERVFTFFENEVKKPGRHRFRFNFKTNRLPSGPYMARLTDANGRTVGGTRITL